MILSKIKGFSKDTLIYGIGDGLGKMIALIMLPILARVFVPKDYGVIDILTVSYAFLLVGVRFGVPSGMQRYFYLSKGFERKRMFSSSAFFMIIGSAFICLILILFSGYLSNLVTTEKSYVSSIIILACCLPIELTLNCLLFLLRLKRKAIIFSVVNVAMVIITPLLTYIFIVPLNADIKGIFAAKIISLSLITLVLLFIERDEFTYKLKFDVFKEVFLFAIPGYPGILTKQLLLLLPRYLLASFAPLTAVGLFGIGFRIANILLLYIEAFNRAWNPFAYSNAGNPDEKRLYEIIFKCFAASIIIVCTILSIFAKEVLLILTPVKYHSAYTLVPGITFYFGIKGLVLIFSTLLYTNNRVKWSSYFSCIELIVFLFIGFLLIPQYHASGVVAAMDISIVVYFILYSISTLKVFYFYIPVIKLTVISFIAGSFIFFFCFFDIGILMGVIYKICSVIILIVLSVFMLIDKNEQLKLKQMIYSYKVSG
jgi:O-antigen/teichoic acid export membrane protein